MSLKRVFILLKKEFKQGSKSFIFIWAVIAPIILSFVISMLLNMFVTRTPTLGIYDKDASSVVSELKKVKAIKVVEFSSEDILISNVKDGIVDVGIVLPDDFDNAIKSGKKTLVKSYVFGESYARNRAIIVTTFGYAVRKLAPVNANINIETENIGPKEVPVKERVLPLIIMISIFFGGFLIPSASLIEEKRKKTIEAIRVASTGSIEIILSKLMTGFFVSLFSGIFTLVINKVFVENPYFLITIIALGALMASLIGTILGIFIKDYATLLSIWKGFGIILFLPAITYMFPQVPAIIGKLSPTYFVIAPIIDIASGTLLTQSIVMYISGALITDILLMLFVVLYARKIEDYSFYLNEK